MAVRLKPVREKTLSDDPWMCSSSQERADIVVSKALDTSQKRVTLHDAACTATFHCTAATTSDEPSPSSR